MQPSSSSATITPLARLTYFPEYRSGVLVASLLLLLLLPKCVDPPGNLVTPTFYHTRSFLSTDIERSYSAQRTTPACLLRSVDGTSQSISYSQTSTVMLGGVHKPDAANNEARPLERRHTGPRPTSATSSTRPCRCRAQSRPLPPPSDASSTRLAHAAPPRRTTARRGLSPRPQRTRRACLRHMDYNYPLLATDCVGRRARGLFFVYSSNKKSG
ncbi:hypothetical protein C8R45DRAFT_565943 [Mycena sanguinolenta]|nr:hypothetical protein C8R45DRAFT_565943 [Mycena sanguinolenta]